MVEEHECKMESMDKTELLSLALSACDLKAVHVCSSVAGVGRSLKYGRLKQRFSGDDP